MKIAFVGTCQVAGMAAAAARILPHATVTGHSPLSNEEHHSIATAIRGYDYVVTQIQGEDETLPLAPPALTAAGSTALFIPPVVFVGFHPDTAYLLVGNRPIDSGMGPYHSQIAVAAYLLGLEPARALALYNAHVFAELGYFDAYGQAIETMVRTFRRHGFGTRGILRRLENQGRVFMHTINHPTIELLERLAALALERLGLVQGPVRPVRDVPDALANGIGNPIFSAIARRIGVDPAERHLRPIGWAPPGKARGMSISDYIHASYAQYARHEPAQLRTPTISPLVDRLATLLA